MNFCKKKLVVGAYLIGISALISCNGENAEKRNLDNSTESNFNLDAAYVPDPKGSNGPCHCPKVKVSCGTVEAPATASMDPETCTIALSDLACKSFGYKTDQLLITKDGKFGDLKYPALSNPPKVKEVEYRCSVRHELLHACQAWGTKGSIAEADAYRDTIACYRETFDCTVQENKKTDFCISTATTLKSFIAAKEFNECVGEGSSCGKCVERCYAQYGGAVTANCKNLKELYCGNKKLTDPDTEAPFPWAGQPEQCPVTEGDGKFLGDPPVECSGKKPGDACNDGKAKCYRVRGKFSNNFCDCTEEAPEGLTSNTDIAPKDTMLPSDKATSIIDSFSDTAERSDQ